MGKQLSASVKSNFEGHLLTGTLGNLQVGLNQWISRLEMRGGFPAERFGIVLPMGDGSSYVSENLEVTVDRIDPFDSGCG